ncbi:MAG: helix-turn-helix transcriptional regulator [Paraglaciecola sp.]|uniref:helix-turn-helix domain-containing protein n=1 Tax=Paraglaciecola sp. TaxID=1920173 RepID=UPI003298F3E8
MTLGKKLKTLRAEHNLSQPELAEKIGIEQSYLSKLENDKSVPSNDIFKQILQAFSITLEQFVSDIKQAVELERLKQIPDVERFLSNQKKLNQNNQRRFLYISSFLIVLATTLFYVGYSKQLFSEVQFQYESDGVLKEGEPVNALRQWQSLLTFEQRKDRSFAGQKQVETSMRINEKVLSFFEHQGPYFRVDSKDGYRHYRLMNTKEVSRPVNAWLQVLGVFLFSAGLMGFVLERRLFKIS